MLPAPALLENEGQGEDLALPTRSTDRQMKGNRSHPEDEKEGAKEILHEILRER